MELDEFIKNFAEQFDDTPAEEFAGEVEFKTHEKWDSLAALTVIAMVDEKYGVSITGEDIRKVDTINELFEIVKSRV